MSNGSVKKKGVDKRDRVILITVIISAVLVIGIVLAVVLPDPISANMKLREAKEFLENPEDIIALEINDQMQRGDDLYDTAFSILRDGEAVEFSKNLKELLNNIKYSETTSVGIGIWKTRIELNNATDEFTLYVDDEGVYIQNGNKLIRYTVKKSGKEIFGSLSDKIAEKLS